MKRARGPEVLQLAGLIAAIVLTAVVNVLGARHFTRWDWTADRRWSLSAATIETLHTLEQPVDVWVIVSPGEPLHQTLQPLLLAYQAQSSRLDVHWIDPDRDAVQLVDLERRFGLEAGRTEDGRVATDAVVIVASGERHWFLTAPDLFEQADDVHVKPREERALTQAVRSVLGGDKARLCFTVGHGELSLEPERDEREGLGLVRSLLEKNNYELRSVETAAPDAHEPYEGCAVVVVAGPRAAFGAAEANRLRTWLLEGGSALVALGPVEVSTETGMGPSGLDDVLAPFGIAADDDLVHDLEPEVAIPDTHGEGFLAAARSHAVTASLVAGGSDAHPPRAAVFFSRSLRHVAPPGAASAAELLVTSEAAYAKRSIVGAAAWNEAPPRAPADPGGPFVLAMASERPPLGGAAHGPRLVVVGSRFALAADNWRQPRPLHGMAFLVDNALSWLAARPAVVDIPERPEVGAGVRVNEAGRSEIERYVLVFMPLAVLLLGAAVWAWRRSLENRAYEPARPRGKAT